MSDVVNLSLTRRQALAGAAGGALVLGFNLSGCSSKQEEAGGGALNAYVSIAPDGMVTVQSPFVEMGQGIYTAMAMLVAEELGVPVNQTRTEQAPPGDKTFWIVREGERFTGGDESIRSAYIPLRRAGAVAREMLLQAAAERWGVDASSLKAEDGQVTNPQSNKSIAYGALAGDAAKLPVPENVTLRPVEEFRILRKSQNRTDIPAKTDGSAIFGIDAAPPNVVYAAVRQAPVFDGEVVRLDPASVMDRRGVIDVVEVPNGVAVVADNYWRAAQALDALDVEFSPGPAPDFSSEEHEALLRSKLDEEGGVVERVGDPDAAFAGAARTIHMDYTLPFLAHATLEPQTCTTLVTDDHCTLWAPNQGVDYIVYEAMAMTGLPAEAITVHTPYLGGAFGRRFMTDYVVQSLAIAVKMKGRPVKLIWSREEDTRHDFYRPMLAARHSAAFDENDTLVGWRSRIVGMGPYTEVFEDEVKAEGHDASVMQGMLHVPYNLANQAAEYIAVESPAPIGFWRSTGYGPTAFFKESAIDEIAHATGQDPLAYRRTLLANAPRERAVLDKAAEISGWRTEAWEEDGVRWAHGVALHNAFDSIVAQVVEASIGADGRPQVRKVWCVIDCGLALNPINVTMQMESGIVFGLSAALHEEVVMQNGRAVPGNFHEYRLLGADEMPEVEVEIIDSGAALGGAGEIATSAIAPALCGALFKLTGERIRRLPIGQLNA